MVLAGIGAAIAALAAGIGIGKSVHQLWKVLLVNPKLLLKFKLR